MDFQQAPWCDAGGCPHSSMLRRCGRSPQLLQKLRPQRLPEARDGTLRLGHALAYALCFSLPTAISFTASTLSNTLAFTFVGMYTDAKTQAAHGLGYSIGNVFVLTVGLGLVNGMDTLCPLVIGAGHREGCWAHLFQALAVVALTVPILSPVVIYSEKLLLLLRQDPVVSHLAAEYLAAGLPALFFVSAFEAGRKFLIYHRYIFVHTVIALCSVPTQVLFLHLFVGVLQQGATGAGIARTCTWFVIAGCIFGYIFCYRQQFGWSKYVRPTREEFVVSPPPETVGPCTEEEEEEAERCIHGPPTQEELEEVRRLAVLHRTASEPTLTKVPAVVSFRSPAPIAAVYRSPPKDQRSVGGGQALFPPTSAGAPATQPLPTKDDEGPSAHGATPRTRVGTPPTPRRKKALITLHRRWWLGIPHFLHVAIPSTFLCVFEWVSFEAQIFMVAYLGAVELSALAASASLGSLLFIINLSVGVTVNNEIGRAMGARRPRDGLMLAKTGCVASACVSVPLATGVFIFRSSIAAAYSRTPEIRATIYDNLLFQATIAVFDATHAVLGGEIRAINMQWYGCLFDGVGLLIIMQVVGALLAFKTPLKGRGFLIGTIVGLNFTNLVGYVALLFLCTDWDQTSEALTGARHIAESELVPQEILVEEPPHDEIGEESCRSPLVPSSSPSS